MSGPHHLVNVSRTALRTALAHHRRDVPVIVAVSGGSDSMALAVTLAFIAPKLGLRALAICIDHGIRPESAAEAHTVRSRLAPFGIDVEIQRIAVSGKAGPEGNARQGRYDAIADYARRMGGPDQPGTVLLGHTQNDQAETVLLGFSRGSGAQSIAGMPQTGSLPLHPDIVMLRPFLGFSREDLRTICRQHNVEWIDDPSNELGGPWKTADGQELRRSALRHRVLPQLVQALGPGTIPAIARTAQLLQEDNTALEFYARNELAQSIVRRDPLTIECDRLAPLPQAVRRRCLKYAVEESQVRSGELVYWHIAGLDKLLTERKNNRGIDLPGVRAWRESNQLIFLPGKQSRHDSRSLSKSTESLSLEDS
ncbi:tRNA lysidine(34) synthetase TilS [Arcanobacterium pinnipediorum]|uniref:tRNA(Ile)-lysidine synthase n=1 Tax=Arcanobacterium pinnipediorum TaxID=1503041 RepID=A0ABY5AK84_9ACTO|nr:tRNA lysidine(34) synthetase TilS [Arcanobacterium pinnipediorum]USR79613.1 tRNA lysidine(34) synthetase TilS [Arcanobacterium pinnipediorum]